ncbi:hypothetical protein Tco_0850732 [Tanacetum coccineum]
MSHFHVVKGNWGSVVKTSAGYNWRNSKPNSNCDSGPTFIRNDHPLKNVVDRGIFNSGCSGHMIGNKDQLEDFKEFNRGSVTFGGSKGYISGKGKIRHKVLFTETECLVVSSDFKMPDENQILPKVPRHHNMYSFDMKTPTPAKGFACLIAKATSDESKLWHKRLGIDGCFDIDYLTDSMNYIPLSLKNQANPHAGLPSNYSASVFEIAVTVLISVVQNQLLDYGFNFMNTKIHIDNESTICIVKNPVYHSKTKHIEIRHHFIRDCYEKKLISVEKIHTDFNVADLLTKPFDGPRFNYLVVSIGIAWIYRCKAGVIRPLFFKSGSVNFNTGKLLTERKYPLTAEVCKAMLDKKLQGGKPDEDCYKLLKMMEKQAGIRKHKDWLVQEQTALGKDFSNPLMADNLPKIVWLSTHHICRPWTCTFLVAKGLATPELMTNCVAEKFGRIVAAKIKKR